MQNALSIGTAPLARVRSLVLALAVLALGICLGSTAVMAQSADRNQTIEVNSGRVIDLPRPAKEIFVANPDIADVQVNSPNTVYVYGRAPGQTSIFAVGAGGRKELELSVVVTPDLQRLTGDIRSVLPGERIDVRPLDAGVALVGNVSSPSAAANAQAIATAYLGKDARILNLLSVTAPSQVSLRVRVAEVSRQVSDQLGINWNSVINSNHFAFGLANGRQIVDTTTGAFQYLTDGTYSTAFGYRSKHVNVNAMLDALQSESLVTILAEPNLTAISGQTASFLAGGEFPVPVAQDNDRTTIEFKEFGVRLSFTPTIIDSDQINLRVRPEVSQLTDEGAITVDNLRIPALATRRAETTVELGSGQSFVIAGLLQNNLTTNVDRYPGLGSLPVIGALFRSQSFQRNQSELIIIVTPYIVRPVTSATALSVPMDGLAPTMQGQRNLTGKLWQATPGSASDAAPVAPAPTMGSAGPVAPNAAPAAVTPVNASGFIVD
jgi:pilus assembly protein CpaC